MSKARICRSCDSTAWIVFAIPLLLLSFGIGEIRATRTPAEGLLAEVFAPGPGPEYVVRLQVGASPQTQLLVIDTAEDYVSVQCGKNGPGIIPANLARFKGATLCATSCKKVQRKLVKGKLTLNSTDGRNPGAKDVAVKGVDLVCRPARVLRKAPRGAVGIAGLGTGPLSLPSILASKGRLKRRFAYCLTENSSPTPIFFGSGFNYTFMLNMDVTYLLTFAPLLKVQKEGYWVGLNSVAVGGTTLSLDPAVFKGGLHVSSADRYSRLVRPAYIALRDAFRFDERGIPRVPAVAPFDTCFNGSNLGVTRLGLPVQTIDLHLRGDVTWTFFGYNSAVSFPNSIFCLAFLDAGPAPTPSVLGTFQQQDRVTEFDLEKGRIGLSSTLLGIRTNCANFNFTRGTFT